MKSRPRKQARPQGRKVARADLAVLHLVVLTVIGAALDPDPHRVAAEDRRRARAPDRLHPRQHRNAVRDLPLERRLLLVGRVAVLRRIDGERRKVIHLHPGVHAE